MEKYARGNSVNGRGRIHARRKSCSRRKRVSNACFLKRCTHFPPTLLFRRNNTCQVIIVSRIRFFSVQPFANLRINMCTRVTFHPLTPQSLTSFYSLTTVFLVCTRRMFTCLTDRIFIEIIRCTWCNIHYVKQIIVYLKLSNLHFAKSKIYALLRANFTTLFLCNKNYFNKFILKNIYIHYSDVNIWRIFNFILLDLSISSSQNTLIRAKLFSNRERIYRLLTVQQYEEKESADHLERFVPTGPIAVIS